MAAVASPIFIFLPKPNFSISLSPFSLSFIINNLSIITHTVTPILLLNSNMLMNLFFFFFFFFFASLSHSQTHINAESDNTLNTHLINGGAGNETSLSASKRFEGSSNLVNLRYHMGPVLSSPINIYLIWYGNWSPSHQLLIKDFLLSISTFNHRAAPSPSVSEWWRTVSLYADQTGANISRNILIAGEYSDHLYSHGTHLTRLTIQQVIATAVKSKPFAVDHKNGIYLVLTATDVTVQDFCRAVCGFHYFTFPSMVGYTLPYAWVGNSGTQCPEVCAYPFAVPGYMGGGGPAALRAPNGDVGVDGMISVIGHELAEVSSNPLVNAWYAGEDPTAPTEIGDLCEGLYGTGGGGGYIGQVMKDGGGRTYNLNGRRGRKFLVQWIWNPILNACAGPNALD